MIQLGFNPIVGLMMARSGSALLHVPDGDESRNYFDALAARAIPLPSYGKWRYQIPYNKQIWTDLKGLPGAEELT